MMNEEVWKFGDVLRRPMEIHYSDDEARVMVLGPDQSRPGYLTVIGLRPVRRIKSSGYEIGVISPAFIDWWELDDG